MGQHIQRYGPNHISISQQLYIRKLKKKYNLGSKSPHTSSIKDHPVDQNLGDPATATPEREKRYRSLLGALLYCVITRADIAVTLSDLSRIRKPTKAHEKLLRRCGDYVVDTADLKKHIKPDRDMRGREIEAWADASFDIDPNSSRSRSGILIKFCGCAVTRKEQYQKLVALSSAEAEYAAANTA